MTKKIFIIAEAGVNHNGQISLAKKLVDVAVAAGVDAVKFQTFKAGKLVTRGAAKAAYQITTTGGSESQYDMLKRLELSYQDHFELLEYCKSQGIAFLSSAFDHDSLDFLVNDIGLKLLKIPSGDINNAPLILAHARARCDIILSTGMSSLCDVEAALGVIAFGLTAAPDAKPDCQAFKEAFYSPQGQKILKDKVTLLHCTSEYPTPMHEVNLRAMQTLKKAFKLKVGYSDHTMGIVIPIAAVASGAEVIEKHFTLDKAMDGPDHMASLEPDELRAMVQAIRDIEGAMGDGIKKPQLSEIETMRVARKSLVAGSEILKHEKFTSDNIVVKRPGDGISPFQYWEIIGKESIRNYNIDDVIEK